MGLPRRTFGLRAGALLCMSLAVLAPSCARRTFVQREVADLQHRLEAPSEAVASSTAVERGGSKVRTLWQVRSLRPPSAYLDWAAQRLRGDYEVTNRADLVMSFAKQTEGDVFYLRLDASPSASGSFVKITLDARPD
jgi:hypothetical protein